MYDGRLEYLRDIENSKFDFTNLSLGIELLLLLLLLLLIDNIMIIIID